MNRAEAQAYLASQGIYPPSATYSGTGATDILAAQRPNPNLGYVNIGAQLLPRVFPSSSTTPQDKLTDALTQQIQIQNQINAAKLPPGSVPIPGIGSGSPGSTGSAGLGTATGGTAATGGIGSYLSNGFSSLFGGSGGTAAPAATADTGLLSTIGTYALPAAGLAAAGYGGYKLMNRNKWDDKNEWEYGARNGAITGAGIGTMILPGVGTAIGGAIGGLGGGLAAQLGGGKGRDQIQRDTIRRNMKNMGLIDDAYNLTLANGGKYDIGKDGSIKNYNVDFSRQGIGNTVAALNPLSMIINQGDTGKRRSDLTGYYTNAAMSGGDANANVRKFYSDAGLDHDTAYGLVHQMQQEGKISKEEGDQAKNALDQAFSVGAYAPQRNVRR